MAAPFLCNFFEALLTQSLVGVYDEGWRDRVQEALQSVGFAVGFHGDWRIRALPEDSAVGIADLFFRPTVGIVVRCDGFAGPIRRAGKRRRMAVVRVVGGAEDSAAVEDRQDLLLRPGHLAIPELEMAAVFFVPVLVQIDQDVDAPIEL